MEWSEWLSTLRASPGRWLDVAAKPLTQNVRGAARVARRARRQALRMAQLLARDGIIARRYDGTLAEPHGGPELPLSLLYVGREPFAREFEKYFRVGPERSSLIFRGGLAQFVLQKPKIEREAGDVDVIACEAFPGGFVHEDDIEHYPMLEGHLHVEPAIHEQIRHVRSRAERKLMRGILQEGMFRSWVESTPEAFLRFHSTLYAPYVRARFGAWGRIDYSEHMRRRYARSGRILFVARQDRPDAPVAGTLLLDGPDGTLGYQYNGFVPGAELDAHRMAELTASLELAVIEYAIARRFTRIAFGYTRAILNDGLFMHKRRIGCTFVPLAGSPLFRLSVRGGRRASIFSRIPILAARPSSGWTALLGFDDSMPSSTKRCWRAVFKNYRMPGLDQAVVWTKHAPAGPRDASGELAFREALDEVLELPAGIEFRSDDDGVTRGT
jgi:hypothetical protein